MSCHASPTPLLLPRFTPMLPARIPSLLSPTCSHLLQPQPRRGWSSSPLPKDWAALLCSAPQNTGREGISQEYHGIWKSITMPCGAGYQPPERYSHSERAPGERSQESPFSSSSGGSRVLPRAQTWMERARVLGKDSGVEPEPAIPDALHSPATCMCLE